jgi:hypothetical protein
VGAQLSPETRDEHFDGVRIAIRRLRVDPLGVLALRHDTAAVVHEVRKHPEFMRQD